MILMKFKTPLLLAAAALLLSACSAGPSAGGSDPADDGLSVVVGLYPYAYLSQEVGGDRVSVTNLTKPGAEPHDLELTTQQVAQVGAADLVVYEAGLQPAVDAAVKEAGPAKSLDVTQVVPLKTFVEADPEESHETEAADEDHGSESGHSHDEEYGGPDPHVWLDPNLMVTIAGAIADQLKAIDPAGAESYTANLATLTASLKGLDQDFSTGLAQCQRTGFITTHAAFGYLADRYHLTQIPISGLSPDAEPSPDRIAEIQKLAVDEGITTIFFETLVAPDLAESIASDLGLATDVLDPIEGITDQSRGDDYPSLMHSNLTALKTANGCA